MHRLAGVSDEVLSKILEYSDLQVANLWCSGDSDFAKRITRCCSAAIFRPPSRRSKLIKLPSLLPELRALRVLTINVKSLQSPTHEVIKVIQSLSSGLTHLELRFPGASLVPLLSSLDPQSEIGEGRWTKCWIVKAYFPRLEVAAFVEELIFNEQGALKVVADTGSFSVFPDSLIELAWTASFKPICSFSKLPRGLQALKLGPKRYHQSDSLDALQSASLPPELTHLDGIFCADAPAVERLPRTLTSGDFLGCHPLTPQHLNGLPPGTKSMMRAPMISIHTFHDGVQWVKMLPLTLTELEIAGPLLDPIQVKHLPRTLISLKAQLVISEFDTLLSGCDRKTEWPKLWPSGLKKLAYLSSGPAVINTKVFPDTLTELTGINLPWLADLSWYAKGLPSSLTSFGITEVEFGLPPVRISSPLPSHWTKLMIEYRTIEYEALSMLPTELRILSSAMLELTKEDHARRIAESAPRLEELIVKRFNSDIYSALPSSLSHINTISFEGTLDKEALCQSSGKKDLISVRPY